MKHWPAPSKLCLAAAGLLLLLAACKHAPSPALPQIKSTFRGGRTSSPTAIQAALAASATRTPIPLPARTSTPTPRPIRTASLTASRLPTRRSTITPKPATPTRPPIETPIFPIGWQPAWQAESVTYIPTSIPAKDASAFQLKPWKEQDAIDLVRMMDIYAYSQDTPSLSESRYDYQAALPLVKLSIQEALHRFPGGVYSDGLAWHLALTNVWMNNPISDTWLLDTIQFALNTGETTPENLNGFLKVYGFQVELLLPTPYDPNCYDIRAWGPDQDKTKVVSSVPVNNLFGDGKEARVFWLSTDGWHGWDGLYFALRQDIDGTYRLYPVLSDWNFTNGGNMLVCIGDHTRDGIPEIVLPSLAQSGSVCGGEIHIYQWRDGRFEDLSRGKIRLMDCVSSWEYLPQNGGGFDRIEVRNFPGEINEYVWYGYWYDQIDSWYRDIFADVIEKDIIHADYYSATQFIDQKLSSWSASDTEQRGASYPDYLRFQLGMIAALQSDVAGALTIFQSLAISPTHPLTPTVSRAAQAFLDNYQGDADVYRACLSALASMEKTIAPYRNENSRLETDVVKEIWGYVEGYDKPVPICNPDEAFPFLVSTFDVAQITNLPAALRQAGVTIAHSAKLDVDGNGVDDWVEVIIKPEAGYEAEVALWVLLNTGQGLTPLPVLQYFEQYYAPDKTSALATFRVETVPNALNNAPLNFLQSGDMLYAFQIEQIGNQYQIGKLYQQQPIKDFSIYRDTNPLEFQASYIADQFTPEWRRYRWDLASNTFQSVEELPSASQRSSYGPTDNARQADEMLLLNWKPVEAIPMLLNVIASPKGENEGDCFANDPNSFCLDRRRLSYLLALAYELTGDQARAVQTYWQLWHDYPASPYALMARAKLEPLNP